MLDYMKVNVDADFDKEKERMGIGIVVRDFRDKVQVVLAAPKSPVKSANVAESLALLRAVILCNELGFSQMHLEGDAKALVDAINTIPTNFSWTG